MYEIFIGVSCVVYLILSVMYITKRVMDSRRATMVKDVGIFMSWTILTTVIVGYTLWLEIHWFIQNYG